MVSLLVSLFLSLIHFIIEKNVLLILVFFSSLFVKISLFCNIPSLSLWKLHQNTPLKLIFLASLIPYKPKIFRRSTSGPRKGLCSLTPLRGLQHPPRPPAVFSVALRVIFYLASLGFISQTSFNFVNSCLIKKEHVKIPGVN